jgi:hypothetical protein
MARRHLAEPKTARELDWAGRLPVDLRFGLFESDFLINLGQGPTHYRYGAWNDAGDWWLCWNTEAEFAEQLADCDFEAAIAQAGA